jgi:hypothetical protein
MSGGGALRRINRTGGEDLDGLKTFRTEMARIQGM